MRTGHQSYIHWPLDAPLHAVQRLPPAVTLAGCASPCRLATRCRQPPLSAPRRAGHPPAATARPSTCADAGLHSAHVATDPTAPQPDPAGSRHLGWIHGRPCRGAPPSLSSPSSRAALCLLRQPLPQAPPPSGRLDLSPGGRICPRHGRIRRHLPPPPGSCRHREAPRCPSTGLPHGESAPPPSSLRPSGFSDEPLMRRRGCFCRPCHPWDGRREPARLESNSSTHSGQSRVHHCNSSLFILSQSGDRLILM